MLEIAELTAQRSKCGRKQVGCVLASEDFSRFWTGYNGGPKGGINTCRRVETGNCGCTHAEMNAVAKCGHDAVYVFQTAWPCERCAVMLVNAGVKEAWFTGEYRTREGLDVFEEVGIPHHTIL